MAHFERCYLGGMVDAMERALEDLRRHQALGAADAGMQRATELAALKPAPLRLVTRQAPAARVIGLDIRRFTPRRV